MDRKAIGSIKRRVLGNVLAVSMVFSGFAWMPNDVQVQAATTSTYDYNLADSIQDGVILQCFDWTYNDIKNELPNIAAALWDYMYTVKVINVNTNESFEITFSVLAWVDRMLGASTNPDQIMLGKAMYYYNQAANELFGK